MVLGEVNCNCLLIAAPSSPSLQVDQILKILLLHLAPTIGLKDSKAAEVDPLDTWAPQNMHTDAVFIRAYPHRQPDESTWYGNMTLAKSCLMD